jgi:hypothetical protein
MGWKVSMIIIQNPDNSSNEKLLLEKLGLGNYEYIGDTQLDECIAPLDKSINIGYYNGCIIICDGFSVIDSFINDLTTYKERQIIKLFPKSEILAVACISTTNAHGYALIQSGIKTRLKMLDADNGFMYNSGYIFEEEEVIYNRSKLINDQYVWEFEELPGDTFMEHQMLEEFTFGVSKRLLGVKLDHDDGNELLFQIPFRKYSKRDFKNNFDLKSISGTWLGEFEYGPHYGENLYGKKVSFKMYLEEDGQGQFTGTCKDIEGAGAHKEVASIHGFREENFISFIKQYPVHLNFDTDNRSLIKNDKLIQSNLTYKGHFNYETGKFTGEWEIHSLWKTDDGGTQEDIVSGIWEMKRVN